MIISIIAAFDQHRGIGFRGKIPWYLPDDLKHFKKTTMNHYVVTGRKTWHSFSSSLPGRKVIVLSRNFELKDLKRKNNPVYVASNLNDAVEYASKKGETELFIAGGESVYKRSMALASKMYLTLIEGIYRTDSFFPLYDNESWKIIYSEKHTYKDIVFRIIKLERK